MERRNNFGYPDLRRKVTLKWDFKTEGVRILTQFVWLKKCELFDSNDISCSITGGEHLHQRRNQVSRDEMFSVAFFICSFLLAGPQFLFVLSVANVYINYTVQNHSASGKSSSFSQCESSLRRTHWVVFSGGI